MNEWTIVIITLIASAFASGTEIAFLSANKLRIELDRNQGSFAANIISGFVKSPSLFIAAMLIANNVALVIYSIEMSERIFTPEVLNTYMPVHIHSRIGIFMVQTFISTMIILVAGEFLPKVLFRINPNTILKFLAFPILLLYYLLYPVVVVIIFLSKFILKNIFRVEFTVEKPVFGRIDLDFYIREFTTKNSQEEEMNNEIKIFQNALDFTQVKVRECMIPRNEIIAINVNDDIEDLRKLFVETKLSKILVYRDTVDNVIGFVHSSEMFKKPHDITQVLLPVSIVPEVMPANELLNLFTAERRSVAVVVDEFGGTSGMVTIEDVMEEIFGEIQDEHDVTDMMEKQISEKEFIFSGRLEIDYINKKYNLGIPEHEAFETLSGFIVHHHENIPEPKEEIFIPPFRITILQVEDNRVEQVRVVRSGENGIRNS